MRSPIVDQDQIEIRLGSGVLACQRSYGGKSNARNRAVNALIRECLHPQITQRSLNFIVAYARQRRE